MKVLSSLVPLALYVVTTSALHWKDCGSTLGKVKSVSVTGCDKSPVCDLPRGSNLTISVDFQANSGAVDAKSVVHGIIGGVPLPFPISHPDACSKDEGITCPLKAGKSYSFHPTIKILSSYPKLKVVVKWELKDPSGNDFFCILLPAQIVDKSANTINRTKPRSNNTPKLMQLL